VLPECFSSLPEAALPLQTSSPLTQIMIPVPPLTVQLRPDSPTSPTSPSKRRISIDEMGMPKRDATRHLSAVPPARDGHKDEHGQHGHSLPLLLVFFVCILAAVAGLISAGMHKAFFYAGCPLGVNGCNAFLGYEKKGFFLVRALQEYQ
ncbi:unnamed protein product, partial [Polarella glacialis]